MKIPTNKGLTIKWRRPVSPGVSAGSLFGPSYAWMGRGVYLSSQAIGFEWLGMETVAGYSSLHEGVVPSQRIWTRHAREFPSAAKNLERAYSRCAL